MRYVPGRTCQPALGERQREQWMLKPLQKRGRVRLGDAVAERTRGRGTLREGSRRRKSCKRHANRDQKRPPLHTQTLNLSPSVVNRPDLLKPALAWGTPGGS